MDTAFKAALLDRLADNFLNGGALSYRVVSISIPMNGPPSYVVTMESVGGGQDGKDITISGGQHRMPDARNPEDWHHAFEACMTQWLDALAAYRASLDNLSNAGDTPQFSEG